MTPIGALHNEKIAKAFFIYVFILAFLASLFTRSQCKQAEFIINRKSLKGDWPRFIYI